MWSSGKKKLESKILELEKRAAVAEALSAAADARANETKALFCAKISQGLRIPLSVIQGYAELLRDGLVESEVAQEEYIRKMCVKTEAMGEVLTHMLMEFRLQNGMAPIAKRRVDVLELLNKAASDMAMAASRRGASVKVVCGDEAIFAEGDEAGLIKVFNNIIENSLKFLGRNINITVSRMEHEVMLVFKDDGPGMDAKEAERIFEMGYQGTNRNLGDGIGMYIVKTEVEAHGGSVFVKTSPGAGMGVYIRLPSCQAS